jgi:hypothetical protein
MKYENNPFSFSNSKFCSFNNKSGMRPTPAQWSKDVLMGKANDKKRIL